MKKRNRKVEHNLLKEIAKHYLRTFGFKENEIFTEYKVKIKNYSSPTVRVDVVGINRKKKIAIECGSVNYSKMKALSKIFDKVINFRAVDALEFLEEKVEQLENELEKERKLNGIIKARMIQKAMVMEFPKLRLPLR